MDFIIWIIVGAIGGYLASFFVKVPIGGLFGNIIAGVLGGLVAGWLGGLLKIDAGISGINLVSIVTSFVGALIVSWVASVVLKNRG